jgi:hypothetical protein
MLQPMGDLRRRAAQHAAFAPPPPPPKPYEPQNRRTAEEIAAERAADAAWKPPASTWNGHVYHVIDGSNPAGAPRGVEVSAVAGTAAEATAELGGAA